MPEPTEHVVSGVRTVERVPENVTSVPGEPEVELNVMELAVVDPTENGADAASPKGVPVAITV